ncbi:MAG: hypothetical protein IT371_00995 [Deltaproteobacteria bacterium]|nr:hypothetical protein [Deltaproteobacteria bacterium]
MALAPMTASDAAAGRVARGVTSRVLKRLKKGKRAKVVMLGGLGGAKLRKCMQVPSCVQAVSRRLKVRYVVAGHVTRAGRSFQLDVRVLSAAEGTVMGTENLEARRTPALLLKGPVLAARLLARADVGGEGKKAVASDFQPEVVSRSDADAETAPDGDFKPEVVKQSAGEAQMAGLGGEEDDEKEDPLTPPGKTQPQAKAKLASFTGEAAGGVAPAAVEVPPAQQEPGFMSRIFTKRYWHAWTTLSVGLGALAGGAAFGVMSRQANQEAADAQVQPEAWTLRDKAQKNALTANILLGAGGAAVATSVLLFALEYRKESKERQSEKLSIGFDLAKGGGSLMVGGRF